MPKHPKLGAPHPLIPGLYRTLPTTAAEQIYPYLRDRRPSTPAPAQGKRLSDAERGSVSPLGGGSVSGKWKP
jgi:hypothetical protein